MFYSLFIAVGRRDLGRFQQITANNLNFRLDGSLNRLREGEDVSIHDGAKDRKSVKGDEVWAKSFHKGTAELGVGEVAVIELDGYGERNQTGAVGVYILGGAIGCLEESRNEAVHCVGIPSGSVVVT